MEKRVLIAVILSFIVLYGYQAMFPPPKPSASRPPTASQTTTPSTTTITPEAPAQASPGVPAGTTRSASVAAAVVGDASERDIAVENANVQAVFTTRGGALRSWRLKKYHDSAGQPLELVPHTVPAGTARPFTLSVPDTATSAALAQALFKPNVDALQVTSGTSTLVFDYEDENGLKARKEFAFSADLPYLIRFSASVSQGGKDVPPTVEWGPGIGSGIVPNTRT